MTPDGMVAAGTSLDENGEQDQPTAEKPVVDNSLPNEAKPLPSDKSAQDEIRTFIRWVRKGNTSRSFNFETLESSYAEVLNKFVEAKDLDGARWYAERYLGL